MPNPHTNHQVAITKPKAVIFDWDNTIVQSRHLFHMVLDAVAIDMNIGNEEMYKAGLFDQTYHQPVEHGFRQVFGTEHHPTAWKSYNHHFANMHLDHIKLHPGAEEFIKAMHEEGIIMSIASNKESNYLRDEVGKLGLDQYFYNIVGADDITKHKPNPEHAYLALYGLRHHDEFDSSIWFIGDSIADVSCAIASGCTPILFSSVSLYDVKKAELIHYHAEDFRNLKKLYDTALLT